jgi:O-glycosyl hydrolase
LTRFFRTAIAIGFLAIFLSSAACAADSIARVDPTKILVNGFQGWGTSLCWWANVVGGYSNRDEYADMVFNDLKINIVRYNIGGGENTNGKPGSIEYRAAIQGFELAPGVWDWSVDQNHRWMLKAALVRGVNRVEVFANSPPYWMTVSGSVTGAVGGTNNLQVAHEKDFAVYLAEVAKNLSRMDGVKFDAITPVNEPSSTWWTYAGHQEGCHIDAKQQERVINLLRAELDKRGLNILIDAPEENAEQSGVDSLKTYSPSGLKNVGQISTHSYKANDPIRLRVLAASLHKPLRQTEYGDGDATGMKLARRIRDDLVQLRPLSWCYWEAVDYWGWGMIDNRMKGDGSSRYTLTRKFYVFEQFTHFLRPGCNIIACGDTNSVASYDPKSQTLAIVTVNTNEAPFKVAFDLSGFATTTSDVECYRTSATENFQELEPLQIKERRFTCQVPPGSVMTYIVPNAMIQ